MASRLKHALFALVIATSAAFPWPAAAQQTQAEAAPFAEGEVRKVDKSAGKITLKHGEIKNLDMPPMTMAFSVAERSLLEQVKVGDRVRFRAADQDGRMTVTEIQSAR